MRRLIVDTNLYVDWLNAREHERVFFQPDAVKFMSAVVMMELLAGVHSVRERSSRLPPTRNPKLATRNSAPFPP